VYEAGLLMNAAFDEPDDVDETRALLDEYAALHRILAGFDSESLCVAERADSDWRRSEEATQRARAAIEARCAEIQARVGRLTHLRGL
jgi:hypothetical protein